MVLAANDGQLPLVFLDAEKLPKVESTRAWREGLTVCLLHVLLPRFVVIALLVFFRASEGRRLTRGPGGSETGLQSSTDFFTDLSFSIDSSLFVSKLSPSNFGRLEEGSSCTNEIPGFNIREILARVKFQQS